MGVCLGRREERLVEVSQQKTYSRALASVTEHVGKRDDAARMRVNLRFDNDRVPCGLPVPSTRKKGTLQIDRVKNEGQNTRQKFDTQKTYLIRRQHHNHPPESLAGHRRHKRGRVIMEYVEHVVPRGAISLSVAASTLEGGRDRGKN
jgi:hypothetical protein